MAKNLSIKITKIGKITSGSRKPLLIDQKGKQILLKKEGHIHQF
jgi:hypothetical protein